MPKWWNRYHALGSLANKCQVLVLLADIDHDGHSIMHLQVAILQHGQAHVEPHLHLHFLALLMHDVLEVYLQVIEQVSDWLTLPPDEEVVHPQTLLRNHCLLLLHFCLLSDHIYL